MSSKKTLPTGPRRLSLYVPKDLSKRAHISYYDETGRRVRITAGVNDPDTYEGRVARGQAMMKELVDKYQPAISLEEKAWGWVESRKSHLRQKSYYGYCSKLRIFYRWVDGRKITKELVTQYFIHRGGEVSGGTLHDDKIYLGRIFNSITSERYFDHLDLPGFQAQTKKHYQRRQAKLIKEYLRQHDPDLWFACQCVYYLFIRPSSELIKLKAHHFDLDEWRVQIPPSVSKTKRNEYILIPEGFRDDVEDYLLSKMPNDYLFPGVFEKSKHLGCNTLSNRYRRHLDELGFGKEYTMYGWKNTGAIACVKAGIHPKILQLQLRHSSLEMTDRYLRRMGLVDMGDLAQKFPSI